MSLYDDFEEMAAWNSTLLRIPTGTSYFLSSNCQLVIVDIPRMTFFGKLHGKTVNIVFEDGREDSLAEGVAKQLQLSPSKDVLISYFADFIILSLFIEELDNFK